ncbi:hypothetical protein L1887_16345 [Cichorium endivia]|nr:hypothetical protein L1887_16345 [Cichorium endivia]
MTKVAANIIPMIAKVGDFRLSQEVQFKHSFYKNACANGHFEITPQAWGNIPKIKKKQRGRLWSKCFNSLCLGYLPPFAIGDKRKTHTYSS